MAQGSKKRIQVQGVHHITIVGSNRQTAIDFWEGLLGMPLIFEQPNLSRTEESHLYFDPGDGRLITIFTSEDREDDPEAHPRGTGHLEHIAFNVSQATQRQVAKRLGARGIDFAEHDRGFMHSIYFRNPNGLKVELACYKFEVPEGLSASQILMRAHKLRVARGDDHIEDEHLADALEQLMGARQASLSQEARA